MTSITNIEPKQLAKWISTLSDSKMGKNALSTDACYELSYFIDDVWADGIELDRLTAIAQASTEYRDLNDLMHAYWSEGEIDEIKKEVEEDETDLETVVIDRIEDSYSDIVLHIGPHRFLVIDNS